VTQHLGAASPSSFPPDLVAVLRDIAESLQQVAATLKRIENKLK
jgi:hypothetical protein